MNKQIRLLVEGFFDDEIFNVEDDIKSDIEDLGRYYEYQVGEIFYQNKKPYAICCGDAKYFKDNKYRFCLYEENNRFKWRTKNKLVKELGCFEFKKYDYFHLNSFNDFRHIDEDGYKNTLIIKNNYDLNEFPAFKYCIELGDNVYLPAIDELLMMYLNEDKLGDYSFSNIYYWSSTLLAVTKAYYIDTHYKIYVNYINKSFSYYIRPFFYLD